MSRFSGSLGRPHVEIYQREQGLDVILYVPSYEGTLEFPFAVELDEQGEQYLVYLPLQGEAGIVYVGAPEDQRYTKRERRG